MLPVFALYICFSLTLFALSHFLLLICYKMSDTDGKGAQGGLPAPLDDPDFEELRKRMEKLGNKERRATPHRLS